MRRWATVLVMGGMFAAGEAAASSFVTLGAEKAAASPSIIVLGATSPMRPVASTALDELTRLAATQPQLSAPLPSASGAPPVALVPLPADTKTVTVISASIIAMGPPAIEPLFEQPIGNETVAAIPTPSASPERHRPQPIVIRGGMVGDAFTAPPSPGVTIPARETPMAENRSSGPARREQPSGPPAPEPERAPPPAPTPPPNPNLRGPE